MTTTATPAATATGRAHGAGRLLTGQLLHSLRELWRSRIVFVFTFLFPLTWLVVLGFMIGNATVDDGSGVRMMQFVTPTAAVMGVLYGTFPTVASSLADAREQGVLKRFRGTPLPAWAYLGARIAASAIFALASLLTMLAFGMVVYDVQVVARTLLSTLVTALVAIVCFTTLGLAVATVARTAAVAQSASIGVSVALGFVSGVLVIGDLPVWADRSASLFPLKHFNDAVQQQFDPFGRGAGWDLGALAAMGAWALVGAVVALRRFRWDPVQAKPSAVEHAAAPSAVPGAGRPRTTPEVEVTGRPGWLRLLLAEVRWSTYSTLRDPGWVFFAIAMPVGLYAFIAAVATGTGTEEGVPDHLKLASGMIAWGAAVTAFVNLPEWVTASRERGALKRLRGTPLSPELLLLGRIVSALVVVIATGALVLGLGVLAYDLRVSARGLPLAAAVLVLGTVTITACGIALANVLPSSKAVSAVGLGVLLPVAFFSDVFVFSDTPAWMQTVGSFFPLKHLVGSVSAALDPAGPSIGWTAVLVTSCWLGALGYLSLRTFRWSART